MCWKPYRRTSNVQNVRECFKLKQVKLATINSHADTENKVNFQNLINMENCLIAFDLFSLPGISPNNTDNVGHTDELSGRDVSVLLYTHKKHEYSLFLHLSEIQIELYEVSMMLLFISIFCSKLFILNVGLHWNDFKTKC